MAVQQYVEHAMYVHQSEEKLLADLCGQGDSASKMDDVTDVLNNLLPEVRETGKLVARGERDWTTGCQR